MVKVYTKNRSRQTRFHFSSFFPRRYRSGFMTRWHGAHNIIIILCIPTRSSSYLAGFIFYRAAVDWEKARVGARVRTFWPDDISDSPPPSPVCFKLLLYVSPPPQNVIHFVREKRAKRIKISTGRRRGRGTRGTKSVHIVHAYTT